MKKIKPILVITTMFIIGGLANVKATRVEFYGQANSFTWYTVGAAYKSTNQNSFSAATNVMGNSADSLSFRAISKSGYEICRFSVTEGYQNHCYYPSDFVSSVGTHVKSEVISNTFSLSNFPIKGVIDYH